MIAVIALVLSGACASGPRPDASVATITFLASSITQSPNDVLQPLIDAFEQANPSIRVTLISGAPNTDVERDALENQIPNGVPDVYMGDVIWPALFASRGLAVPLSDHLPAGFWKRFDLQLVHGATYRSRVYAAPFFSDTGLLYYRKDLVAQPPTTWEQLQADAQALQRAGRVTYGFVWEGDSYEGLTCVWTEMMSDAVGKPLNADGVRSEMDSPKSLMALQFLRGLVTQGVAPPDVGTYTELQVAQEFVSGQTAFARTWNNLYANAVSTPGFADKVGVAPLPTFDGGKYPGYSTIGGWDLYVNPHTQNLGAALTFIRWMTDAEAQEIVADYSEGSVNVGVQQDARLVALQPVLMASHRANPVTRPADTPAYPALSKAIFTEVNAAVGGKITSQAALAAAVKGINRAISSGAG